MADVRTLAVVAGGWIVAGLNLGLLFELKATLTTLAALLLLTGLAMPRAAWPVAAAAFLAPVPVFAAALMHPLAALAVLALVLAGLVRLLRPHLAGRRARWMVASGAAAVLWPAFMGLVSNAVVEVACPKGGIETACYGFYRVGAY